ncbi:hypothetical protein BT63DRAFT_394878 [Microthyrium microscopicum]|uniref:DNA-directed RNA polymerase II subunit RPB9-like zinc ribbon domain-containing protein n=1 Tax=Microthyrium microscopicum TaxID=703497 RepID=A0A6A6UQ26_9PEZI|nr:hypothetical protein BT63DRAFT_394878 [Microthyrium microscopicum]
MSNNDVEASGSTQQPKITFKFCRECSNLLYPQEDRENSKLVFACRSCPYSEPPISELVHQNDLSNKVGETAGITQDIGQDPTVRAASFFPELCTMCGQEILCDTCGKPNAHGVWLEVDANGDETSATDPYAATTDAESFLYSDDMLNDPANNIFSDGVEIDFYDEDMLSDPPSDDDHGEYYIADTNGYSHGGPVYMNGFAQSKPEEKEADNQPAPVA